MCAYTRGVNQSLCASASLASFQQSNRAPSCSLEVSAAGLPCLEHFRVQCYTQVKSLLVGFRKTKFTATQLQDLKQKVRAPIYLKQKAFVFRALPSREEPDISLSIVNSKAHFQLLYTRALCTYCWFHLTMNECGTSVSACVCLYKHRCVLILVCRAVTLHMLTLHITLHAHTHLK